MHRFIIDTPVGDSASLSQEELQHALRVLRLSPGEEVELLDGTHRYVGELTQDGVIGLRPLPDHEPGLKVTLFQGLPKAEKMELIVQKCTEIGVWDIVPVTFSRCVVKLGFKDVDKLLTRWQRIAAEAAKQCGRARVPQVHRPVSVGQIPAQTQGPLIMPWEEAHGKTLWEALPGDNRGHVGIIIGPEGGIDRGEADLLQGAGAVAVTLGPRILRTETAGLCALTLALGRSGALE